MLILCAYWWGNEFLNVQKIQQFILFIFYKRRDIVKNKIIKNGKEKRENKEK